MARPRSKGDYNFIAYSDIMTGLAIIFLFIAVAYILEGISDKIVKDDIYNAIGEDLKKDFKSKNVELDKDMSLKFLQDNINKTDELFQIGSAEMTPSFKSKVADIWPKYQQILLNKDNLPYISEIRIEGHTDTIAPKKDQTESYLYNLNLSSARAQSVLSYIRSLESYNSLPPAQKEKLDFLLTANGMSYSRALNSEGEISALSKTDQSIDLNKSRRVEFRINTSNEELQKNLSTK
ncbi:OmpA family protein [Marnyiella aurantia]|uniref:OmpA family protein n=1 Tax=Marnyiella aurantia TaxID=2758037 RepID=A0A7D7LTT7_9FLAO|nr:OmpA family protein [Marnyiella aurantia]MBA5245844.1 OmpA family protein [Marnyiella aurantia]QMS98755.1 OmpA family protein [Marnyiella aurantia]